MPRASRTRALLGPIVLALSLLALAPAPADGAEATPITTLPGQSFAALVTDLDGDGSRDLLRIRDTANGSSLEVWEAPRGTWALAAAAPIRRPGADGQVRPFNPSVDPALILATRRAGRVRPLLILGSLATSGSACCGSGWWIDLADGSVRLTAAPGLTQAFDQASLLDTDADGTDELLLFDFDDAGTRTVMGLLRQVGDRWTSAGPQIPMDEVTSGGAIGESDGQPGEELVMSIANNHLWRIGSDPDGRQWVETVPAPGINDPSQGAWPAIVADGRVVTTTGMTLTTMRWPRGGPPAVLHTMRDEDGGWLTTLGASPGASARAILVGNEPGDPWATSIRVLDPDLRTVADFGTIR
jgi:hypothetical protein